MDNKEKKKNIPLSLLLAFGAFIVGMIIIGPVLYDLTK
mgnify:CR=1 FL=1